MTEDRGSKTTLILSSAFRFPSTESSAELAHGDGGVAHAVGEAPLVVVPAHDPHEGATLDLGLVHVEHRGMRVMVEVGRHVRRIGPAQDALELVAGSAPDGVV